MNENTGGRQILYGYIREHLFMSPREHADMVNQMAKLAERDGHHLAKVFTEKIETVPQAFEALVQAVIDNKVEAIILPNLHHFGVLGYPPSRRDLFEKSTGAKVLVFDPAP